MCVCRYARWRGSVRYSRREDGNKLTNRCEFARTRRRQNIKSHMLITKVDLVDEWKNINLKNKNRFSVTNNIKVFLLISKDFVSAGDGNGDAGVHVSGNVYSRW